MHPTEEPELDKLDPEIQRLFQAATRIVLHDIDVVPADVLNAQDRLHTALDQTNGIHRLRSLRSTQVIGTILGSIAVATLFVVAGWRVGVAHVEKIASTEMLTYATANGERATVTLPDGNQIMLNVASRLEVPADYVRGNRNLRLSGSAIFNIVHQSAVPFTVQAGPSTTRVLGTTFMVRYYPTDTDVHVVVSDGKVSVQSSVVPAMQQADVSNAGLVTVRPASATQLLFDRGILTIEDTPLPKAIADLNRWYNADIRLGDTTLAIRAVGGKFSAGSLEDLMEFLEFTLNIRAERDGRVLTLFPR